MIKRLLKTIILCVVVIALVAIYLIKRPSWVNVSEPGVVNEVMINSLREHVIQLSDVIKDRSYLSGDGLTVASEYIEAEMKQHHESITTQPYHVNGQAFQNVVATHGPDNAPIIVVGAHYDAYGSMPGADDNASGVAGLLTLNQLLAKHTQAGHEMNKQIILVAFTLEEPPIYASKGMGSVVHAESVDGEVVLMISLEMIGYFSDESDSQDYPISALSWVYPDTGHFITVVDQLFSTAGQQLKQTINQQGMIEAYSINAPTAIPGIDFSDHRSYWALGMPAIMVTDTAFYRNKNYHTAGDTHQTLDYKRMSFVIQGVFTHLIKMTQ